MYMPVYIEYVNGSICDSIVQGPGSRPLVSFAMTDVASL